MSEESTSKDIIYVTMFGNMTLRDEGVSLRDAARVDLVGRSRRLWMIIAYLIVNRKDGVVVDDLIRVFWPNDHSKDPLAKLQNNMSRARALLGEAGLKNSRDLISCNNGIYRWAPHCTTVVDVDQFDSRAKAICNAPSIDDLDDALEVCDLYTGNFLDGAKNESWCRNLVVYFESLFIRLAEKTVEALFEAGRTDDVERLCLRVLDVNPVAEQFSVYLMRALTESGNPKRALEHFETVEQELRETYGVSVQSGMLAEREAASQRLYGKPISPKMVYEFLQEEADSHGAFNCSHDAFRNVTRFVVQNMQRTGAPSQLATVRIDEGSSPEQHAKDVRRVESVLESVLRSGDVYTRVGGGGNHFLVLFPGASEQDGPAIVERLLVSYEKMYPQATTQLDVDLYALDVEQVFDAALQPTASQGVGVLS